jgi:chromosome segregation ATPase
MEKYRCIPSGLLEDNEQNNDPRVYRIEDVDPIIAKLEAKQDNLAKENTKLTLDNADLIKEVVIRNKKIEELEAENEQYHQIVSDMSSQLRKVAAKNKRLNQTLQKQADRITEYIKNGMEYKRKLKAWRSDERNTNY